MQTVTACRRIGMEPILYLNAYVQPDENDVRANMLLDRILGRTGERHSRPAGRNGSADRRNVATSWGLEHAARLEKEGHRCYDVPMGGASLRRFGGVCRRLSGNDGAVRADGDCADARVCSDGHGRHARRTGCGPSGAGRRAGNRRRGRQPQGRGLRGAVRRAGERVFGLAGQRHARDGGGFQCGSRLFRARL